MSTSLLMLGVGAAGEGMQVICLILFLYVAIALGNSDTNALLELKKSIEKDPSGLLNSWDSKSLASDGCPQNWYGISCNEGKVVSITLSNVGLVGEFNFQAINGLKMLRNLSILNNFFTGSISHIGPMESLEVLDLSINKFNGLLPSDLVKMHKLIYLDVSSNEFEGTFPVGLGKLERLKYVDLHANSFSGDIMLIFSQMGSVVHVDLSRNRFSGSLDLGLANNSFLSSIKYLNISHNSLTGELFAHDGMPYLDNLVVFDASNNQLEGTIPSFNFVVSLEVLRLGCNKLSGSLPETLLQDNSMMLSELDLSQNKLEGSVGSITSVTLKKLNMSSNKLSGSLPRKVAHCAIIDLSNNMLSGNLSRIQYWGNYVEVVQLSSNLLTGMLPNQTSEFLRLSVLKISNNSLEGVLPPVLGTFPELKEIDLSGNLLSGFLLPGFFTSIKLIDINLSGNKFSGSIPIQQIPNDPLISAENFSLMSLDLSYNNLSGHLPPEISKLHNLAYLNLCNNKFEGTIPDDLPDKLIGFNVSFNNLSGTVPDRLKRFPESAFHPGNSLLMFPQSSPPRKDNADHSLNKEGSRMKSVIWIVVIVILVAIASLMAIVGIVSYFKKDKTTRKKGAKEIGQQSSSMSDKDAPNRNKEASSSSSYDPNYLPSFQMTSAEDAGNIYTMVKKPKDFGCAELVKNEEGMPSPMSFLSASNPSSSRSDPFENPGALKVCSPHTLVGDLHLFDSSLVLTAEEFSCAPAEVIGRSCHGRLYKATLKSGHVLAVKWFKDGIAKGKKEFVREVKKLGTIRHPNLVSIQGYYCGPKEHEKLIISNCINALSLDIFLREASKEKVHLLSLDERLRVAVDVARCLHYLHNEKAIPHGNLKSSNILLETLNRNVLLTDYSLHRLLTATGTAEQIINSGALGYLPPEFSSSSKPSPSLKSDVFAFGVILLELLTGRNSGEIVSGIPGVVDLTDWIRFLVEKNRSGECFDRLLLDKHSSQRPARVLDDMLKVALRCILPASERPDMKTIFEDLSIIR